MIRINKEREKNQQHQQKANHQILTLNKKEKIATNIGILSYVCIHTCNTRVIECKYHFSCVFFSMQQARAYICIFAFL